MGFNTGDRVVCIINFRTHLEIGKSYTVDQIFEDDMISLSDCDPLYRWVDYYEGRFISEGEWISYKLFDVLR